MAVWSNIKLSQIQEFNRTDAEFYKPDYLASFKHLLSVGGEKISTHAYVTDGIHASPQIVENGIRYISAKCVKDNEFVIDNCINISPVQNEQNPRTQLSIGDVIITTVGTIGNVAVVEEDLTPCNCDRHVGIIRIKNPENLSPFYLSTFLNSRYGKFQSLRESAGNVQLNLYIRNIGHLVIPRLGNEESEIANLTKQAYQLRSLSKKLYSKAQQLLESELGLDKLSFQKPAGYTAKLSELELSRRADADFFNPELRHYQRELEKRHLLKKLPNYAKVLKFSNPPYASNGVPIITQKHLGKIAPDNYGDDLVTLDSWVKSNPLAVLRRYDLLYYSVGAYLGKTNQWLSDNQAVHASFITMLRCHDETDAGFLQVLLNSRYGILQSKCFQSGTSQPYIYPKDIRRFLIPDVSQELKREIHSLLIDSYKKAEESKVLLEQAKTRVEQLIEEVVQA